MDIGAPEILIILVLVVVLFGVGRIGKIGGELGQSIRQFREGLQSDGEARADASAPTPASKNDEGR